MALLMKYFGDMAMGSLKFHTQQIYTLPSSSALPVADGELTVFEITARFQRLCKPKTRVFQVEFRCLR